MVMRWWAIAAIVYSVVVLLLSIHIANSDVYIDDERW